MVTAGRRRWSGVVLHLSAKFSAPSNEYITCEKISHYWQLLITLLPFLLERGFQQSFKFFFSRIEPTYNLPLFMKLWSHLNNIPLELFFACAPPWCLWPLFLHKRSAWNQKHFAKSQTHVYQILSWLSRAEHLR